MKNLTSAQRNGFRAKPQVRKKAATKGGSYAAAFNRAGIRYKEKEKHLAVGELKYNGWLLYVSVIPRQGHDLLGAVLPYLREQEVPFEVVKDQPEHKLFNEGEYGMDNIGKNIVISAGSDNKSRQVAKELAAITDGFMGVEVLGALRVSQNIYAELAIPLKGTNEEYYTLSVPDKTKIPFEIDQKYSKPIHKKKRIFVGSLFVLTKEIVENYKGTVHKAINLKKCSMTWCLVKHGRANASTDEHGRTIRDRLLWQKKVITELQPYINTPKLIDYFEQHGDSYLVTGWADGNKLKDLVSPYFTEKSWKELEKTDKEILLGYFLSLLEAINAIHERGYVHRDITPGNFILQPSGAVTVIDFELAYSLKDTNPIPPFGMGTIGYVSPQQMVSNTPTIAEDIYALGSVLIYILTGKTKEFKNKSDLSIIKLKLKAFTEDEKLVNLCMRCIKVEPASRPNIVEIKKMLTEYLSTF